MRCVADRTTQIFDTTFCGSWAGNVWAQSYCATVDASCVDYVAKNPQAYANGYWLVVCCFCRLGECGRADGGRTR